MSGHAQPRSWLYVPGHQPERFAKALRSGADAIVIDLEDGVPRDKKDLARSHAAEFLSRSQPCPVFARVSPVASGSAETDIAAIAMPGLSGVRVAKVESPDDARQAAHWLEAAGSHGMVHCLLETARGVEASFGIAEAHPRVTAIALGEADLAADLGVTGDGGLAWARSRVIVAARAAGLPPPAQSVYPRLRDIDGLRASCHDGKSLGFHGRSAIHPDQLPVIHEVYTPMDHEVQDARRILEAFARADADGTGTLVLPDGRFVDRAVAKRARRILALADSINREPV